MIQGKRKNTILLYSQILALGLLLVFSPCSMRNSIQELLHLEQTQVNNKSKTTKNDEAHCANLSIDIDGNQALEFTNTIPKIPLNGIGDLNSYSIEWKISNDLFFSRFNTSYTIPNKIPLYLLHQQFKSDLLA